MADTGGSAAAKRMGFAVPEKVQLHLAMLALQFGYAGFHVVSRAALNMGISKIVFPVYRNILAFSCSSPSPIFSKIPHHCRFCERDPQAWLVHSGAELFSVFYAGVVASGIAFAVQIWCIDKGGPVFVAVYQPVQTLVVALVASVVLGEEFYLGGIIGAVLIIIGLYFVLWGKNEEAKFARAAVAIQAAGDHSRAPTSHIIKSSLSQPLLQSTENA
nr:protein WALLS ARE THIN 1-like [Ipomoea batatas]